MVFDHTALNIAFPVLTLLFFDSQSRLFHPSTSHALRSLWYGIAVALPHLVNLMVTPLLSALSDLWGRRYLLLLSTLGAIIFTMTAALGIISGWLSLVLASRIVQGAFSRTNPIAQAVVGDISQQQHKLLYMGYLQLAISVGAFIGPIIGGYLAERFFFSILNFSLPYLVAMLFALVSWLLTLCVFKETKPTSMTTLTGKHHIHLWSVFKQKPVLQISLLLLCCQFSWGLYYQFMPPILKILFQSDDHHLGIFIGLIAFWLALATSYGIKWLKQRLLLKQLLTLSLYLVLIGLILTGIGCTARIAPFVWVAAAPTAMGDVIAYSCICALYSDAVSEQGHVMGVCFMIVGTMWALTGLLGGLLIAINPLLPFVFCLGGILILLFLWHRNHFILPWEMADL